MKGFAPSPILCSRNSVYAPNREHDFETLSRWGPSLPVLSADFGHLYCEHIQPGHIHVVDHLEI